MMGATGATVTRQISVKNVVGTGMLSAIRTSANDTLTATAKVCTSPISSDATKAPESEPSPPTTTTTNRIGPSSAAILDWVTSAGPAITPATPANAEPTPN